MICHDSHRVLFGLSVGWYLVARLPESSRADNPPAACDLVAAMTQAGKRYATDRSKL